MFKCKDPLADLLKEYGFNLILLPKSDIEPLQLLVKDGNRLEKIGHLRDLFKRGENIPMPRKSKDIPLAKELQSRKSSGIKAEFGVSILSNFLNSMTSKKPKPAEKKAEPKTDMGGVFETVDTFVFAYKNVLTSEISHIKLDQYIHDAELSETAKNFVDKLKKNQVYVITAILKSNAFETEFTDKNNFGVKVSLPQIRKIVDPEISIGIDRELSNKMIYESEEHLVFGFKAVKIIYDKKTESFKLKSIDGVVMRDEEDFPVDTIEIDETLVDIV